MFSITSSNFRNLMPVIAAKAAISLFSRRPSLRGATATRQSRRETGAILDCFVVALLTMTGTAFAATSIPFTINTSEAVNVTGTPRIAVDVGGTTRYATYTSGTGTNALTFTYAMVAGDVDLDGVALSSPIDLNGGTLKDLNGNDATLTFTPPNTSNVKVNYPSLGMDFVADADGRYTLNGTVYNDLTSFLTATGGTFTRASTATYFDSTGTLQTASSGTPRFDYDPATHAAKGILIEESRTNYLTQSQTFISSWGMGNNANPSSTITLNSGIAPDSTNSASLFTPGLSGNTPGVTDTTANRLFQEPSGTNTNTIWSASIYVKTHSTPTSCAAFVVNKQSDTVVTQSSITTNSSWQRVSATGTTYGGTAGVRAVFSCSDPALIWGAQLEQGAFATSYIPTTTAAVTRAADSLTLPTGSWFFASEGAYFSQWNKFGGTNTRILGFDDPTNTPMAHNGSNQFQVFGAFNMSTGTAPLNSINKGGSTYKSGLGTSLSGNGSAVATNSGVLATPSILRLAPAAGTNYFNGWLQKVKYYPLRFSNTQLQLMTQ